MYSERNLSVLKSAGSDYKSVEIRYNVCKHYRTQRRVELRSSVLAVVRTDLVAQLYNLERNFSFACFCVLNITSSN